MVLSQHTSRALQRPPVAAALGPLAAQAHLARGGQCFGQVLGVLHNLNHPLLVPTVVVKEWSESCSLSESVLGERVGRRQSGVG